LERTISYHSAFSFKLFLCFILLGILFSCKKDTTAIPPASPASVPTQGLDVTLNYKIDNDAFITDQFIYYTPAGYNYSISNLSYYISRLNLIKADCTYLPIKDYQFIDAQISETNNFILATIPEGNYIGIKFNIGLDSSQNISFILPPTTESNNMQWPQLMGGGYHFLKLEGNYKDTLGTYGYTMHLGTNNCLIPIKIFKPITIAKDTKTMLSFTMNINEWFKNPHLFDFNTDANNIMGDSLNMKKIAENGADVFTINP
jgi:hypothetical protein